MFKADRYILHCSIGCILFTSTLFPSFPSFNIKLPPAESSARLSDLIQFTTFTPSTLFLASVLLDDLTAVAAIDLVVSTSTQMISNEKTSYYCEMSFILISWIQISYMPNTVVKFSSI